jgi:exonuclease VII large subunit
VLQRGYAIVQDTSGQIVKDADEVPAGSNVQIRLAHGRLDAQVK